VLFRSETASSKKGLTNLLEVATFLDVENTIIALSELKMLNVAAEIIQA
jgi:hypothetical protein